MNIEEEIMTLRKSVAFQRLSAYYSQSTTFNILRIERSENRHSAFLSWLLNPKASHKLGDIPLKKFLALAATKAIHKDNLPQEEVIARLISGDYSFEVKRIIPEQTIVGLVGTNKIALDGIVDKTNKDVFKTDSLNRFDIWMLLSVSFTDSNDKEVTQTVPVVVENKIYSKEGSAGDENKAQTVRYAKAIKVLRCIINSNEVWAPILVYLAPTGSKEPTSKEFIPLTYQELLDHVIMPASMLLGAQQQSTAARIIVDDYIRNLSMPSRDGEESSKDYSILAIAENESQWLEEIFNSKAFQVTLTTLYPKQAKALLNADGGEENVNSVLIDQFWTANEDLFKIVIYNHFKNDIDKLKTVKSIVKESNRDNTRYKVGVKVRGEIEWLNEKPAAKGETAFLIAKAYCENWSENNQNNELSLKELNGAFPGELNEYFSCRYLKNLFYNVSDDITYDVNGAKVYGNVIEKGKSWDFHWDDSHKLPHVQGDVRIVKMWRKADFDRLLQWVHNQGYDKYIIIEPCT